MVSSRAATLARVLQRGADDLGRVDDAGRDQVAVLVLVGVVAVVLALHLADAVDDHRAVDAGVLGDVPQRIVEHVADDLGAELLVARRARASRRPSRQRSSATPPPATMPSSSAACVAARASSSSALRSFISVSVAAPTLICATPPASLASRSCSFSRS